MFIHLKPTTKTRITVTRKGSGAYAAMNVQVQGYQKDGTPYDKSYINYGDEDFELIIEVPESK